MNNSEKIKEMSLVLVIVNLVKSVNTTSVKRHWSISLLRLGSLQCVVFVLWYLFWTSTILIYCKCRPDISFCTFEGRSVLSMSGCSFIQSAGVVEREGAAEWGVEGDRQHTSTFSPLPSFTLQVPSTIISSSNSPSSYYTISAVIGVCQTTV